MDKNTKQMKAQRAKREEAVLNRVMAWLAGGAVLEFLLLLLNQRYGYIDTWDIVQTLIRILSVAGVACTVFGLIWLRVAAKNGAKLFLPAVCTLFSAGVAVGCLATWFLGRTGLRLVYVSLPVLVALVLVYYLYQREFFFQACGSVLALLGVWLAGSGTGNVLRVLTYVYVAAVVLALLGWALLCRKAQGGMGKVTLGGKTRRLFSKGANYPLLYVGVAVNVLVSVLALTAVPAQFLYGAAAAWLLVAAVYYTMKLM